MIINIFSHVYRVEYSQLSELLNKTVFVYKSTKNNNALGICYQQLKQVYGWPFSNSSNSKPLSILGLNEFLHLDAVYHKDCDIFSSAYKSTVVVWHLQPYIVTHWTCKLVSSYLCEDQSSHKEHKKQLYQEKHDLD